jgi:hypothetical protein
MHRASNRGTAFWRKSEQALALIDGSQGRGLTQSAKDLIGLAVDEEIDPIVLVGELIEERLLELRQSSILLTRDRNSLSLIFGCVFLDQSLELVIIDVPWRTVGSAQPRIIESQEDKEAGSHCAHCGTDWAWNVLLYFIPSRFMNVFADNGSAGASR